MQYVHCVKNDNVTIGMETVSYACLYCNKRLATQQQLAAHLNERHFVHLSPIRRHRHVECPMCSFSSKSVRDVKNHLRDTHTPRQSTELCLYCNLEFTPSEFACHLHDHHACDKKETSRVTVHRYNPAFHADPGLPAENGGLTLPVTHFQPVVMIQL
jgi:DNA-directed RNA polymerase subunit RPC12/RpoP